MASLTRRDFTRGVTAASIATAFSNRRVLGANERVNIGIIGSGGRGQQVLKSFLTQSDVNPVAVSDVY